MTDDQPTGPYYVILDVAIRDVDRYLTYMKQVAPALEAAGGRYLARGGALTTYEGDWRPPRIVLIEFPSQQALGVVLLRVGVRGDQRDPGRGQHRADDRRRGASAGRARRCSLSTTGGSRLIAPPPRGRRQPSFLPGFRIPCGSNACFTARWRASAPGSELAAQAGSLQQAHAVFAAHGAAEVDRGVDDLVERRLRAQPRGVVAAVCDQQRMQVAVAGVGDGGDEDVVAGGRSRRCGRASRPGARAAGRRPRSAWRRRAARAPGRPAAGRRTAPRPPPGRSTSTASRAPAASNSARIAAASGAAGGLGQVGAGQEQCRRVVREAGVFPLVHRPQAVPVDQLERRGLQTPGRDAGDGGPARGQGVEEPDDGPGAAGRAGRSRTVISVMTPSVPSEPTISPTRS